MYPVDTSKYILAGSSCQISSGCGSGVYDTPKSISWTHPEAVMSILEGFMSRCAILCGDEWRYASADRVWNVIERLIVVVLEGVNDGTARRFSSE